MKGRMEMDQWIDELMNEWMDKWINEWMDG